MAETFGEALRRLREVAGVSAAGLAKRINSSKAYVGHLEAGRRPPTMNIAQLCDEALDAHGVLTELAAYQIAGGDDVKRRALLHGIGLMAGVGAADMSLLAQALRASLMEHLGLDSAAEDWTELAEEHGRRCMTAPPEAMRQALVGDLLLLDGRIGEDPKPWMWMVLARLAALHAMTVASMGDRDEAIRWYRTAKVAADASEDRPLIAWVRGRELLRSDYDGYGTPDSILSFVARESGLVNLAPVGRMEVTVAAARAYARIGEHHLARQSMDDARRAFDTIPTAPSGQESMYYLPEWRFMLRGVFVDAMAGDVDRVERALGQVSSAAGGPLRWAVQADLNRALAQGHQGNPAGAADLAISTVAGVPRAQHTQTMRQLVDAVCVTLADDRHRDAARHLREMVA